MNNDKNAITDLLVSTVNILKQGFFSSLYNNAIFLILNSGTTAVLGFVFWNLMARNFAPATVGIGSALFAAAGLISSLANLGLGNGLVRFVPESGAKGRGLATSIFCTSGMVAAFASIVYMAGARFWSPALAFVTKNYLQALGFMAITAATALSWLFDSSFVARRAARYVFWKNVTVALVKMPLPVLVFFALGGYGIFLGNGVAIVLALIVAFFVYLPRAYAGCEQGRLFEWGLLRPVLAFSFSNYLAGLFSSAVGFIFPLMVLNLHGAENSAYFYMAWMISTVISVVPNGVATSLFAECSHHPERLNHHVQRSLWLSLGLLVPAVGTIYLVAPFLLRFFGHGYAAQGTTVLRWLLLANFPLTINSFYSTVNQVRKKMTYIMLQAFATSVLTLGLGYLLLTKAGLPGIGMAYTGANLAVALVVAWPLGRAVREVSRGGALGSVEVADTDDGVSGAGV